MSWFVEMQLPFIGFDKTYGHIERNWSCLLHWVEDYNLTLRDIYRILVLVGVGTGVGWGRAGLGIRSTLLLVLNRFLSNIALNFTISWF